jgi:hypothetical protein
MAARNAFRATQVVVMGVQQPTAWRCAPARGLARCLSLKLPISMPG